MRFNKISFENYRCFLNGSIDFEKSPEKKYDYSYCSKWWWKN